MAESEKPHIIIPQIVSKYAPILVPPLLFVATLGCIGRIQNSLDQLPNNQISSCVGLPGPGLDPNGFQTEVPIVTFPGGVIVNEVPGFRYEVCRQVLEAIVLDPMLRLSSPEGFLPIVVLSPYGDEMQATLEARRRYQNKTYVDPIYKKYLEDERRKVNRSAAVVVSIPTLANEFHLHFKGEKTIENFNAELSVAVMEAYYRSAKSNPNVSLDELVASEIRWRLPVKVTSQDTSVLLGFVS